MDKPTRKESPSKRSHTITKEIMVRYSNMMRVKGMSESAYLKKITHLHLGEKKLRTLSEAEFRICKNLRVLYLQGNHIPKLELLPFKKLTHLYLQNNDIAKIEGLDQAQNLSKLYLNGNRISSLDGLQHCTQLVELHLSDQRLEAGQSMDLNPDALKALGKTLSVLTMANAGVHTLEPLLVLSSLVSLDVSRNLIEDIKDVCRYTEGAVVLEELQLAGNPVSKVRKYRERIVVSSHLSKLDDKDILDQERQFLKAMKAKRRKKKAESKTHGLHGPFFVGHSM
mmetsp:Transcript_1959/g.3826  ORF Transcript_1959/g.3826 Transcript_1959/m.3826 type:complete len:282 (-) Transcript_1959:353-1198(-)|eukprot:CAMPEP_0167810748 /NCGR_PEP_ID=MMETSP0112_2-20121227/259_1 /TAXON_ID=91324 /ORGANISM="Lotharella globosa, Strain CCCM811" /LENGTH=281 /DNA_ID=CAMNT_0007709331 /DNA_START=46 /DNA_END=891 /DNA_ORIENTATION=-